MPHTRPSERSAPGGRRPDLGIRTEVQNALVADRRIDGTRIEVQITDDVVTLTGEVERREQKRWAEEIATAVAGVRGVHNALHVTQQTDSARAVFGEPSNTQGSGSLGE